MKKVNKIVALLVALTFLFSLAAVPAGAAAPTATEQATARLSALGVIEGYPDGSFGEDRPITRAEFAKVAAIAAGYEAQGEMMKNMQSKFSDVKAGDWYTGWVNLAASLNYIKGYPDGTFKPNANITQQEVVTVLMRLLGYNDNLPGDWPYDYLIKATDLGVLDDVTLDAAALAVRGDVFVMTSAALDQNLVSYNSDDDEFTEKDGDTTTAGIQAVTLLASKFDSSFEDGILRWVSWDDGDVVVDIGGTEYTFAEGVDTSALMAWEGTKVNFVADDDNEINFIAPKANAKYVAGTKFKTDYTNDKVVIDGKSYKTSVAGAVYQTVNGTYSAVAAVTVETTYDQVKAVLDSDGKVEYITLATDGAFPAPTGVVDEIDTDNNMVLDAGGNDLLTVDEDDVTVVVKDGVLVDWTDLEEGDLVWNYGSYRGADLFVMVSSNLVSGTLEEINAAGNEITVDGTTYKVGNVLISVNDGDSYTSYPDGTVLKSSSDYFGEPVTLGLNKYGEVAAITTAVDAAADTQYALFVEDIPNVGTADGVIDYVKLFGSDGEEKTYQYDTALPAGVSVGDLVSFTLDSDGVIDTISLAGVTGAVADVSGSRIQFGTTWYYAGDAVIFSTGSATPLNPDDFDTRSFAEAGDKLTGSVDYILDGQDVAYIVTSSLAASGKDYAMVVKMGVDANGDYVELNLGGTVERFGLDGTATVGDFVYYSLDADNDATVTKITYDPTGSGDYLTNYGAGGGTVAVSKVERSAGRIYYNNNANWLFVDSDTVYYSLDGTTVTSASFSDVTNGDTIYYLDVKEDGSFDGVYDYIIIVE